MRFSSSVSLLLALSQTFAADLALYWGQASAGSEQSLGDYCKNSPGEIYIISFVDTFGSGRQIKVDISGYWNDFPGTGLPDAPALGSDIKECQSLGKKVLLSLGGASGSYGFNSDADAEDVATQLWNYFGAGQSNTRPFGDAKIDGFDLDIEAAVGAQYYTTFVNKLRQLYATDASKQYYVSAAPQCPFPDASVGDAVANAQLDFLFVQFYNNYCSLTGSSFNFDTWQNFASTSSPNKNVKVYLGLPGSQTAAGSGYATVDQVKGAVDKIKSDANFGGIMLWDASQGNDNIVNGQSYAQQMQNLLEGSAPAPASSSSAVVSASSSSAAASASSSSAAVAPSSTPAVIETSPSSTQWWTPSSAAASSVEQGPAQTVEGDATVTVGSTAYTTIPCSTPTTLVYGESTYTVVEPTTLTVPCTTTPAAPAWTAPASPTVEAEASAAPAGNGDVYVTQVNTFYTTIHNNAVQEAPPTSTVKVQSTLSSTIAHTSTITSAPPSKVTSPASPSEYTSDGVIIVLDTVWTTDYTTTTCID